MDNPCFGCKARHARCHVDCKRYSAFRAQRVAEYEATEKRGGEAADLLTVTARRFKRSYKKRDGT